MSRHDPFDLPAPLLDSALGRLVGEEGTRREQVLAELVAAHPEHAERLRSLDRALAEAGNLLTNTFTARPEEPSQIDAYRVVRRLGEGAFGVVYLCEQDEPIRRQVAIKVLRPGAGDRGTLQRFATERQLLAEFQHPAIASVIDAGTLPDGRPWVAMEYVQGEPVTEYCDHHRLPVDARLALFLELCHGMAHAHARGVVHRDLKPANVLVTERDGRAVPKIIDFGVAKALHATKGARHGDATATGRVVGTPGYMSPEQSSGDQSAVDARSDVFSLGVILYELLAGCLPWPKGADSTTTEAPRPSTRLHREPRVAAVAAARATVPRALAERLSSELDWIVLEALHPRREMRYQTAAELADDVGRHLRDEPVRARPPSVAYRLRKLVRRHRAKLAVAAALSLAGLGIVGTSIFRHDALASEAEHLNAIEDAVTKLILRAFDPRMLDAPGSDGVQRDVLRDALALHDRVLQARSSSDALRALRICTLNGIADVHFRLAQYRESIDLSVEAEREAESLAGAVAARVHVPTQRARAQRNLARCHIMLGNRAEASTWSARAVEAFGQLHANDPGASANPFANALVENATARNLANDAEGELAAQRRAISVLEEHLRAQPGHGESTRNLIRFRCGLAGMLSARGDARSAESVALEAQSLADEAAAATDDERAIVSRRLALLYQSTNRPREAAAAFARAAELTDRELQKHPGRPEIRNRLRLLRTSLSELLYEVGDGEAADRESERAAAVGESLRPDHPDWATCVAETLGRLGWAAVKAQRFERHPAIDEWLRRARELTEGSSERGGRMAWARAFLAHGFVLRDLGQPFSAAQWEQCVAAVNELLPNLEGRARVELARCLRLSGDAAAARKALADAAACGAARWALVREACLAAIAAGDPAAAAREAEALFEESETWQALQTAAEALTAAVRHVRRHPPAGESADVGAWREQAIHLWRQLVPELAAAPATALPARLRDLFAAQARVALAGLGDEPLNARATLAASLPVLDRMRGAVEASLWDEALWVDGHAATFRAEVAAGELDAARAGLLAFVPLLADAEHLVVAAGLWTELARAARHGQPAAQVLAQHAEDAAITALRRAIDLGFRDRSHLLACPELTALRPHPGFAEILASLGH
ncbi:MAG TPA: serine/threonine-protein kinase [Planctomycetota bacterium]